MYLQVLTLEFFCLPIWPTRELWVDNVYKPPTWVNDAIMATIVPRSVGFFEDPFEVCFVQWVVVLVDNTIV